MKCPKCSSEMKKGIVGGANRKVQWGTGFNQLLGTVDSAQELDAYKCEKCGYVEIYTNQ